LNKRKRLTHWAFALIFCLTLTFFSTITSVSASGTGSQPLDQLLNQQHTLSTNPAPTPLDISHIQGNVKEMGSGTQVLGIDVAVFFFEVGCIILILAAGLRHPEYQKWGRGTIFAAIIGFIMIKFGPIIFYRL
jgi:hypothetical protein